MAERKQIDWEGVERDYSAGLLTLREIGDKYGTTHTSVKKRADKEGWSRDLSAKIAAAAEKKVSKEMVSREVSTETAVAEKAIIEAGAQAIVDIKLSHRRDIARGRKLISSLFDELESCTDNRELFEQLGEMLRNEDDKGMDKLNDIYQKVISLPQRIDGVKKLSEALRVLIDKERQAFDIQDKTQPPESNLSQLLKMVQGNAVSVTSGASDFDDDEE